MQAILDGTITNDKFCMSRVRQKQWKPGRVLSGNEVTYPLEGNEMERVPQEDGHETPTMECSTLHSSNERCPASLGPSLPIPCPREQDLNGRSFPKPCRGGAHQ